MNSKLLPLGLLAATDGETIEGITRFQKLVFLAQEEQDGRDPYTFRARDYGPFSKELYADLDRLVAKGFLSCEEVTTEFGNTKKVYELNDKGRRAVENSDTADFPVDPAELEEVGQQYGDRDFWDLLEYVYESYPRTTRNSELSL
jgi:DNA-binding PadR family transcriptional regulator